jgi:hypothetical protein
VCVCSHAYSLTNNKRPADVVAPGQPVMRVVTTFLSASAPLAGGRRGHVPAGQSDMEPTWVGERLPVSACRLFQIAVRRCPFGMPRTL